MPTKTDRYVLLIVETSSSYKGAFSPITKELEAKTLKDAEELAKEFITENYFSKMTDIDDEPLVNYALLLSQDNWNAIPYGTWLYQYNDKRKQEEQEKAEYARLKAKFEPHLVQPIKKQSTTTKKRSSTRATKK